MQTLSKSGSKAFNNFMETSHVPSLTLSMTAIAGISWAAPSGFSLGGGKLTDVLGIRNNQSVAFGNIPNQNQLYTKTFATMGIVNRGWYNSEEVYIDKSTGEKTVYNSKSLTMNLFGKIQLKATMDDQKTLITWSPIDYTLGFGLGGDITVDVPLFEIKNKKQ